MYGLCQLICKRGVAPMVMVGLLGGSAMGQIPAPDGEDRPQEESAPHKVTKVILYPDRGVFSYKADGVTDLTPARIDVNLSGGVDEALLKSVVIKPDVGFRVQMPLERIRKLAKSIFPDVIDFDPKKDGDGIKLDALWRSLIGQKISVAARAPSLRVESKNESSDKATEFSGSLEFHRPDDPICEGVLLGIDAEKRLEILAAGRIHKINVADISQVTLPDDVNDKLAAAGELLNLIYGDGKRQLVVVPAIRGVTGTAEISYERDTTPWKLHVIATPRILATGRLAVPIAEITVWAEITNDTADDWKDVGVTLRTPSADLQCMSVNLRANSTKRFAVDLGAHSLFVFAPFKDVLLLPGEKEAAIVKTFNLQHPKTFPTIPAARWTIGADSVNLNELSHHTEKPLEFRTKTNAPVKFLKDKMTGVPVFASEIRAGWLHYDTGQVWTLGEFTSPDVTWQSFTLMKSQDEALGTIGIPTIAVFRKVYAASKRIVGAEFLPAGTTPPNTRVVIYEKAEKDSAKTLDLKTASAKEVEDILKTIYRGSPTAKQLADLVPYLRAVDQRRGAVAKAQQACTALQERSRQSLASSGSVAGAVSRRVANDLHAAELLLFRKQSDLAEAEFELAEQLYK